MANISTDRHQRIDISDREFQPMSELLIDHFSMPKARGFSSVLIATDVFSGYIFLYPVKNESSKFVANSLDHLFAFFGPCKIIKSDNSKSLLRSKEVQKILLKWGIQKTYFSLPHAPFHNARVERRIRSIRTALRKLKTVYPQHLWTDLIHLLQFTHNSTPVVHRIDDKVIVASPFEKFFMRKDNFSTLPDIQSSKQYADMLKLINQHIKLVKSKYRDSFNKKAKNKRLSIGDFVLLKDNRTPAALEIAKKHKIPYYNTLFIIQNIAGQEVLLEDISSGFVFKSHIDFLKKYYHRPFATDFLNKDLKKHFGDTLYLDISEVDRSTLLKNLMEAGFDIGQDFEWLGEDVVKDNSAKPKIIVSKSTSKNISKSKSISAKSSLDNEMSSDSSEPPNPAPSSRSKSNSIAKSKTETSTVAKEPIMRKLRNRLNLKQPSRLQINKK